MKNMTFVLKIEMGNDAMLDHKHVANALRAVAKRLEEEQKAGGGIKDVNGNTVGRFAFVSTGE